MGNETKEGRRIETTQLLEEMITSMDSLRDLSLNPDSKGFIRLMAERRAVELVRVIIDQGLIYHGPRKNRESTELKTAFANIWQRDKDAAEAGYDVLVGLPPTVFPNPEPENITDFVNNALGVVVKNGEITPLGLPKPTAGTPIGARKEA